MLCVQIPLGVVWGVVKSLAKDPRTGALETTRVESRRLSFLGSGAVAAFVACLSVSPNGSALEVPFADPCWKDQFWGLLQNGFRMLG